MYPSAALCRSQQALHLSCAAAATLGNVKLIAERDAAAWGVEAAWAEDRGGRQAKMMRVRQAKEQSARDFSENPDRGFADDGV